MADFRQIKIAAHTGCVGGHFCEILQDMSKQINGVSRKPMRRCLNVYNYFTAEVLRGQADY